MTIFISYYNVSFLKKLSPQEWLRSLDLYVYCLQVSSGVLSGILSVSPEKIQAVDMDTLNNAITYSFLSGTPASYKDYFEINPNTGIVRQTKAVDTSIAKKFEIIVKVSELNRKVIVKAVFTFTFLYGI